MGTLTHLFTFLTVLTLFTKLPVEAVSQRRLNYIGDNLDVKVKLTDNLKYDGKRHTMLITLNNKGTMPIDLNNVDMYFHSFFMVEPDFLPAPKGHVSRKNRVKLHHINGMLFKMEFLQRFGTILPGQSKTVELSIQDWAVSKTDVPNNWYVTSGKRNPVTLKSTAVTDQSFVEDFTDPNQYKRYNNDQYSPFTPIDRYNNIKGNDLGKSAVQYGVIPTPKQVAFDSASPVTIGNNWVIAAPPSLSTEAAILGEKLRLPTVDTPKATQAIILELGDTGYTDPESYVIKTLSCADAISIKGATPAGVFYGMQTLLGMLSDQVDANTRTIPGVTISDEPRYEYRGVHLDVARNFHPKETVMKLIDTMSQYKLNKLHLHLSDDEGWRLEIPELPELTTFTTSVNKLHIHLSDDEGWRLEIPELPELTTVASRRCHDLDEKRCIIPQLGSSPTAVAPGTGYYTKQDYRDILEFAKNHHVEVIPELQMPSHAHAAIKAMEERFRRKNDIDNLLTDLEDTSDYLSVQMFTDDAMNPCIESTYNFVRTVLRSVKDMHIGISPLKIFNLGGEAVPLGAWVNSTACRKAFPYVPPEDLPVYAKAYFMSRLAKMVIVDEGMRMAGYEDAFFLNGEPLPGGSDNLLVYPSNNVWEWGIANRAYKFANARYPVVMSPVTHLSFDHPYEPDPEESGLYWASRYTDTYKTFTLRPDNLYDNIDVKRSGEPITRVEVCGVDDVNCDPLLIPENIKGIQSFGWSELIKDKDRLEYMLFPRVLALAERAWNKAEWENSSISDPLPDWERFANKVGYNEYPRLDRNGVKYRVPPPGIAVSTNNNRLFQVTMRAEYPGLRLQYSLDGGRTYTDYTAPFNIRDINRTILLRTLSADGLRSSRVVDFSINKSITG